MPTRIKSSGEPRSPKNNLSNQELIDRITRLQKTVAVRPADLPTRSELATLLEQANKPEEALANWAAILAFVPKNLKAREGMTRCLQLKTGPASSIGERELYMASICGTLDRIEEDIIGTRWIYVTTSLLKEEVFRVRVRVGRKTEVRRGKQEIDFSEIYTHEFAEVTYHLIHDDILEADTIYVCPECDPAT
jgi:hypothetical protein